MLLCVTLADKALQQTQIQTLNSRNFGFSPKNMFRSWETLGRLTGHFNRMSI